MGPIWDFDVAFGNYQMNEYNSSSDWFIKYFYWITYSNLLILKDSYIKHGRTTMI